MNIEYLVNTYSNLLYKICYDMLGDSEDALDATQETYIKIYKSISKYSDVQENELRNIICKIALNVCKDILKSKVNKVVNITDSLNDNICYEQDVAVEEQLFKKDRKMFVIKMVNELKSPYKEVINEYYINELSLDEISLKLSIPKPTLKVQINRAKNILKERIKEKGGENFL